MSQAHAHLAYAPRGAGVLYATLWFAEAQHIYGWFIGSKDGSHLASFFMLQDYFSLRDTRLFRSVEDDVYSAWVDVRPEGELQLPHPPPVPEIVCHELSRLQDHFIRHWLFFDDDPATRHEADALHARGLAVRHVNIRAARMDKLRTAAAVWRYDSPDADMNVLIYLSKRWPIDYEAEASP